MTFPFFWQFVRLSNSYSPPLSISVTLGLSIHFIYTSSTFYLGVNCQNKRQTDFFFKVLPLPYLPVEMCYLISVALLPDWLTDWAVRELGCQSYWSPTGSGRGDSIRLQLSSSYLQHRQTGHCQCWSGLYTQVTLNCLVLHLDSRNVPRCLTLLQVIIIQNKYFTD